MRITITGMKVDVCWAMFRYARLLFHTLMIGEMACVLLFATPVSLASQTLTFHVLVLDALNDKPQANVKIEPLCAGPPRNFFEQTVLTNDRGIATVSYACGERQEIELAVFPPNKKEQCGGYAGMT